MATRVNIPVTAVLRTGVVNGATGSEVAGDSTNHHYFANDERTFVHARNAGATPRTVTLVIAQTIDGQSPTNPTVSIPATSSKLIGPFPNSIYQQTTDAPNVYINVDHSDLKLQAFKL